ncbi:septum site-determining protein MinC [Alicyclobacillus dauci]|uniref:Probable septum site-determining protein MinC n=1 Tax=Alicyclobacillus dauci TaxID=1475485 RepID=A0ABY6Z8D5_9BACL|nr:septum site-determining protein MinC [Alicyclobacillus dauci]WAH38968.1 septation ring formation regulator EzrA [Alicyclobacillus dauci]
MIINSESLYETKPLVTVKGTRDGLLFLLDEHAPIDELCAYVTDLLSGQSGKVFDGPIVAVVIDYGRRQMSPSDCGKLLSLFMARPNFAIKAWGGGTQARQSLFHRKNNSRAQTIYHGVIRAGQPMAFEGDVVIVGDVNPSAEVRATGDIYVFGRLLGIAHAGVEGDTDSIVAATEFSPMQLRIGDVVSRAPRLQDQPLHAFMEFAYLENGLLAVAQMRHFYSWNKARSRLNRVSQKGNRA